MKNHGKYYQYLVNKVMHVFHQVVDCAEFGICALSYRPSEYLFPIQLTEIMSVVSELCFTFSRCTYIY